jgi:hypothetical protein
LNWLTQVLVVMNNDSSYPVMKIKVAMMTWQTKEFRIPTNVLTSACSTHCVEVFISAAMGGALCWRS